MLKNIKNWYLLKFKDTTKEEDEFEPIMSNIGIAVKMRLIDKVRFIFKRKYEYRLTEDEVTFIKKL